MMIQVNGTQQGKGVGGTFSKIYITDLGPMLYNQDDQLGMNG